MFFFKMIFPYLKKLSKNIQHCKKMTLLIIKIVFHILRATFSLIFSWHKIKILDKIFYPYKNLQYVTNVSVFGVICPIRNVTIYDHVLVNSRVTSIILIDFPIEQLAHQYSLLTINANNCNSIAHSVSPNIKSDIVTNAPIIIKNNKRLENYSKINRSRKVVVAFGNWMIDNCNVRQSQCYTWKLLLYWTALAHHLNPKITLLRHEIFVERSPDLTWVVN